MSGKRNRFKGGRPGAVLLSKRGTIRLDKELLPPHRKGATLNYSIHWLTNQKRLEVRLVTGNGQELPYPSSIHKLSFSNGSARSGTLSCKDILTKMLGVPLPKHHSIEYEVSKKKDGALVIQL